MPKPITVLMIEDEVEIIKIVTNGLGSDELIVIGATTARDGRHLMTLKHPDIVLLDLGLPDQDGLDVIRQIRQRSEIPIIVLSARDQESQKIDALENGADDYLTKPFMIGELMARIKVALRHSRRIEATGSYQYEFQGLKVNLETKNVSLNEQAVYLTPIEYKILSVLTKNAGRPLTYAQILKEVWGMRSVENNNNLRIHMQHLREKLCDDALCPIYIITLPGIGYKLNV